MQAYIILLNAVHKRNTAAGNRIIHLSVINAKSYGHAEKKITKIWKKLACEINIIQISLKP